MTTSSNSQLFKESLRSTLSNQQELYSYLLTKFHLNQSDQWISTNKLVSCLYEIEAKIGPSTLKRIGYHVGLLASMSTKETNLHHFLQEELNGLYRMNHLQVENGFNVSQDHHNFIIQLQTNPYPLNFNKGLLKGFCSRHSSLYSIEEMDKSILELKKII